jgi:hypothetical protein
MNTAISTHKVKKVSFAILPLGQSFIIGNTVMVKTQFERLSKEGLAVNAVSLHDGCLWCIQDHEKCTILHCNGFRYTKKISTGPSDGKGDDK